MVETLVTNRFKTFAIRQIQESITEPANTVFYGFASKHTPYTAGDSVPPAIGNSPKETKLDPYRSMLFGKKLENSNVKLMVPRVNWTANTVYDMYDHRDTSLFSKDFYVSVDAGSQYHVYKCLYNANGAVSSEEPSFNESVAEAALYANNDQYYETSDGYQWRYMYSVDDVTFEKFATTNWMPVVANTSVESAATDGAIDVIKVDSPGANYNNYDNGEFDESQLKVGGDSTLYHISSSANTTEGFYGNTILHITGGDGAGEYKRVANSYITAGAVAVKLESAFTTEPTAGSTYELSPEVKVTGDGTETINCVARAVINSTSSNSVHQVEIIERGEKYVFATAEILTGSTGNTVITAANVAPIISPIGGHGADPFEELGATSISFVTEFANNEGGYISTDNDYRQFGIIQDPKFSNVVIYTNKVSNDLLVGSDGTFVEDETWYQFKKIKLYSQGTTIASANTIEANESDTVYDEFINIGDYVYITDTANNDHFISQVNSLDANTITLDESVTFSSGNVSVYIATLTANGTVNTVESGGIRADNVSAMINTDRLIIGATSKAIGTVSDIELNNTYSNTATFATFTQMKQYVGSVVGTFIEDEFVYQSNGTANVATGYLHSAVTAGDTTVSLTETEGVFTVGGVITGNTSGATLTISDKYNGELEPNSGDIVYLQNDVPISRANTQTETIKVILEL